MSSPAPLGRATARPTSRRDRWLAFAVPLLVVAVATGQLVTATTSELTPWRGVGFGMFSTLDGHGQRIVRVEVTDADGDVWPVDVTSIQTSPATARAFVDARALPSTSRLERLGRAVAATELHAEDGVLHTATTADSDGAAALASPVTVELSVYRTSFDADDGTLAPHHIATTTVRP